MTTPFERYLTALDHIDEATGGTLSIGAVGAVCPALELVSDGDLPMPLRQLAERVYVLECEKQDLLVEIAAVDQALIDERVPVDRLTRMGRVRWLGDARRIAERRFDALDQQTRPR